jgi:hypothetical protein
MSSHSYPVFNINLSELRRERFVKELAQDHFTPRYHQNIDIASEPHPVPTVANCRDAISWALDDLSRLRDSLEHVYIVMGANDDVMQHKIQLAKIESHLKRLAPSTMQQDR